MCGCVGVAGNIGYKEEKVFRTLLMLDTLRGRHSTGAASMQKTVSGDKVFQVVKDSVNGVQFTESKPFTDMLAKKHYILLGHNRHATQGAIIQDNAHPFEFDNVIGAHNGSLAYGWKSAFHDSLQRVVDSEAIYSEMNHSDAATVWGKLNGPATLTWINKREGTVNFIRNKDRPLFWTTANQGKTLVWASEPWMLHVACGREDVKLDDNPRDLPVNTHLEFTIPTNGTDKVVVKRQEVTPYVAPKWDYGSGSRTYSSRYCEELNDGAHFLEKEGIKIGEAVEFTVEKISDYFESGNQRCSIQGRTLLGTKISAYNVDSLKFEDKLLEMWEYDGMVFTAKIKYTTSYGLIFDIESACCVHYTLADIAEAQERQAKESTEDLANEIKLLAASLEEKREKLH